MFLNGVKINEWLDDPTIDLARIGIAQRAVGTPLSEDESAPATYGTCLAQAAETATMARAGIRGKESVYISSESVGVRLTGAGSRARRGA